MRLRRRRFGSRVGHRNFSLRAVEALRSGAASVGRENFASWSVDVQRFDMWARDHGQVIIDQAASVSPAGAVSARFVFVGGLHRSGTSLITSQLCSCANATGLVGSGFMEDEGHHLHDVVPSVHAFGGPGRFAFDPRSHLTEAHANEPRRVAEELDRAWRSSWHRPDAGIRVEKSPQNLLQSRFLQAAFPDASFVMVIRHPAAVALATRKWTGRGLPGTRRFMPKTSLRSLLEHWIVAHDVFADDLPHLDRVQVVRFEDLLAAPTEVLAALRRELGLSPTASHSPVPPLDPLYRIQWRQWLRSPIGQRAQSTWLAELEPSFNRWGYAIDDAF